MPTTSSSTDELSQGLINPVLESGCAPLPDPLWPWPRLVAHRGGGKLAPENTIESLALGSGMGFLGAEVDAMLSLDGVPVLMHDESLQRTAGQAGFVSTTPITELVAMDAGLYMGERWVGSLIPSLKDALEAHVRAGLFLNIEIKPARGYASSTGAACALVVADFVSAHPEAVHLLLFSSFSKPALAAARRVAPHIPRGLLLRRGAGRLKRSWLQACARLECKSVHAHYSDGTARFIAAARAAGLGTLFYTVDDPKLGAELFARGAGCLCCDDLHSMGDAFSSLLSNTAPISLQGVSPSKNALNGGVL